MRGILVTTGILVALGVISTTLILRWKGAGGDQVVDAAEESRGILPREKRGPLEAGEAREYSDRYDQSRALLIGIGEPYGENAFPVLPNAERDVTALGKRLRTISSANDPWSVEMLLGGDATHDRILERLGAFTEQAGDNDKVLVYYAGHGARHEVSENSGWIIPADGLAQERDPNRKNGLRFDEFGHLFDESRSKPVLVAMDCCYGGRLITPRSISRSAYSRRLVAEPAKIIISSGRPNEQVSDGVRGENSPFARAFLEALSRPDVEAVTTADIVTAIHNRFLEEEVSHLPVRVNPPERHSPAKSCSS